jgi:PAS domain S-box-containing protein
MSDAVTVYDLAGNIVFANKMASDNMRYASVEQLMHQTVGDISDRFMLFDESGALLGREDLPGRRALRINEETANIIRFVGTEDDENFWLSAKAFPITDRSSRPIFVVVCYHDITSHKEAEEMLRDSNRRIAGILDDLLKLD